MDSLKKVNKFFFIDYDNEFLKVNTNSLLHPAGPNKKIKFSELNSFKIDYHEFGADESGANSALLGGILFGTIGAVAGLAAGRGNVIKIDKFDITFTTIKDKNFVLHFIPGPSNINNPTTQKLIKLGTDVKNAINDLPKSYPIKDLTVYPKQEK